MNVALCILSYGRHEMTAKVLKHNLSNTGVSCGLFVSDMEGIARSLNIMLRRAYNLGYEYFCFCGNDIFEPSQWLEKRVWFIEKTKDCGMVSVPVDYVRAGDPEMVIGNFMISRSVVDTIGAFDERFDPYGAIDLDYNKRCIKAGLSNYYLPGELAVHLQEHSGEQLYGFNKAEMVRKTWKLHEADIENYKIEFK